MINLNKKALLDIAEQKHHEYVTASPFPHIVIDDFLPPDILDVVLEEFPNPGDPVWLQHVHANSKKMACNDVDKMGQITQQLFYQFNSALIIEFLEKLTGISGLIPDTNFTGGGLHCIGEGGFLKIHADFNFHEKLKLDRRLNLLVYLNKNWKEDYGGHLELWDKKMTHSVKKILPIFNRCVVFDTTDFSFHGHPDPLQCPNNVYRKSLALYYYSNGRPLEEKSDSHSTLYQARPHEIRMKHVVKKLLPPIIFDFLVDAKTNLKKKSKKA